MRVCIPCHFSLSTFTTSVSIGTSSFHFRIFTFWFKNALTVCIYAIEFEFYLTFTAAFGEAQCSTWEPKSTEISILMASTVLSIQGALQ